MRLNMNNNGRDGQGALEQLLNTTEQQLQLPHRKNTPTHKQSCACITGSSYTSRVIGQQLQVPEKFRKREQTAYLKYYNNAPNNISNANISNNSLTTTSKSCFSFCKTTTPHLPPLPAAASTTTGVALNSNLVHRAIASLVWHITASTAISIFATLFYLMANTQGASAVLAITAIASSASSSSSSTSLEHLGFYLNINHTTTTPTNNSSSSSHATTIKSSEFLNFHPNVNVTEISILNYVSSSSPAKYNNNNNNINNNNTITLTNTKVISVNESLDDLSAEDASEYIFDRTDVRIIFITLYTMVFCCCFFGNLLVILVVTLSRRLRSITNFFLANLALADFCVGLFCVMQNLSIYLIDSWVFGEFLCRMYQFVHSLSYTASIFILVVICMERYFAIVHPITCKQILTAARLRMVILTVWITSAVYSTPKFVFSKTIKNVHTESGREEEICVLDRKMFNSKLLDMINFGLLYCIPLLVMTVLYSKIAVALWRSSRGLQHHLNQQENSMTLHNSMYHHQQQQQQQNNHNHNNHQQQQLQHQQPTTNLPTPLATPISVNKSIASSSTLSHKPSCKYEKRDISTTDSQVTLDADRPVVSTCRKTSFYQHSHHSNHLTHQQPTAMSANHRSASQTAAHHGPGLHGSQRVSHISHSSNNVLRARRGVVRMLIIFVLTFALCNLPYHARKMWQYWSRSYRGDSNFNALLTPLTFLVTYFNSGINPLLYAFLSRNFRKGMRELLMCSWRKSKTKSSTNSSMHHKRHTTLQHSMPTDTTHIGNEQL